MKTTFGIRGPAQPQGGKTAITDLTYLKKTQSIYVILLSERALMLAQPGIDPMHSSSLNRETAGDRKSAIVKRSVELNGHKTSVSLEDEFWNGLRQIAETRKSTLPNLLQNIDSGRGSANLSSAIRVFVLSHYREQAATRHAARLLPQDLPDNLTPAAAPKINPSP